MPGDLNHGPVSVTGARVVSSPNTVTVTRK